MMMAIRSINLLVGPLLLVALLASLGCSDGRPARYPVRGVVRFTDGSPLKGGAVEFHLIDAVTPISATGNVQEDGSFVMGTYDLEDGVVAGRHRVVVISRFKGDNRHERPGLIPIDLLHKKYREIKTSDLECTVEEKPSNEVVLEVEYAELSE